VFKNPSIENFDLPLFFLYAIFFGIGLPEVAKGSEIEGERLYERR
jgi:hypothetical protein